MFGRQRLRNLFSGNRSHEVPNEDQDTEQGRTARNDAILRDVFFDMYIRC